MNSQTSKEISERDKVIIGADGWLFLTNDSNNSVAQFVGEINLDSRELEKLSSYIKAIKNKISCEFFFSIAPNKEFVHPEKYPFRIREKGTPLIHEQVLSILAEHNVTYHYPVGELASIPGSFYKTDTHWSEYGAYSTLKIFFRSNYEINLIDLDSNCFVTEYVSGDLGSKLDGREDACLNFSFTVNEYEVFNSGLRNNGFGSHYVNPQSMDQRKVLIFGDSFGASYVGPLVLTFREVIFLYSPAAFIENVYTAFSPDFVLLEINQRFLTKIPRCYPNLEDSPMFRKFRQMDSIEIESYAAIQKEKKETSILKDLYLEGISDLLGNRNSHNNKEVIFSGDRVDVKANIVGNDKNTIVVTFSARSDKPHKSGFGEYFFEKNSISAIHFISKANHWWQIAEMQTAIEKAIPLLANYKNIYTYGTSMGGHGALIFSKALGATHIIAGSPQYAIKGRLVPWDRVWEKDTKDVSELFTIEDGLARTAKVYCIFDPYNDFDLQHISQIIKLVPIVRIKTAFSGHSAILQLKNQGLLSDLLKTLVFNTESVNEVIKQIKLKRADTLSYLNGLGKRASLHSCRQKVVAWAKTRSFHLSKKMLFGNSPQEFLHSDISPVFKSHCALLVKNNNAKEAISIAEAYVQKYPDVEFSHDLLSYVYWKIKDYDKALLESKRALRLNKQDISFRISVIRLCLASGQVDDLQYHVEVILGRPFKNKSAWVALYEDMNTFGAPSNLKLEVGRRIREMDLGFEIEDHNKISADTNYTSSIPDERWNKALARLVQLRNEIEALSKADFSFFKTLMPEDYFLFDKESEGFSGADKNNYLFVHKTAAVPLDSISIPGSGNVVVVSSGASLTKTVIKMDGKNGVVFLGSNVRLRKCSIRMGDRQNYCFLGDGVTWEGGSASVMEDDMYLEIKHGCMFSSNVDIMTSDKHPIFDRLTGERINKPGSVVIHENVWMGRGVRVGKGVHLAPGGIIGQGSLVTKSTKPYAIYAGTPARLIRENVEWRRSLKEKSIAPVTPSSS